MTKRPRPRPATTGSHRSRPEMNPRPTSERWTFCIYVTDQTPRSRDALQNLTNLCEAHLPGRYAIEVVDLLQTPERARADAIVAIPTIIRTAPQPRRTVIGDLTDLVRAKTGLQLCG